MMQGKGQAGNENTEEKHKTQSSGAGSKGKTHVSAFNFFFPFQFSLHKMKLSLCHKGPDSGAKPPPENGAALCGSHWLKSAFPKPRDSMAPFQHRDFMEKSKAGYSELTGTHKEGTAVGFGKLSFLTRNTKLRMRKSTVFMAMLDPVCHFCCWEFGRWKGFQKVKRILTSSHF